MGGVNKPVPLVAGDPAKVREEAFEALRARIDIIAPEYAVPLEAPLRGLLAIREAVDEWAAGRAQEEG